MTATWRERTGVERPCLPPRLGCLDLGYLTNTSPAAHAGTAANCTSHLPSPPRATTRRAATSASHRATKTSSITPPAEDNNEPASATLQSAPRPASPASRAQSPASTHAVPSMYTSFLPHAVDRPHRAERLVPGEVVWLRDCIEIDWKNPWEQTMATPSVSPAKSSSVASSQRENEHLRKRVRLQVQTRPATTSSRDARLELLRASVATAEQTYLGQVSKMAKELKELGEDFNRHMTALKEELKKVQDEPVQ